MMSNLGRHLLHQDRLEVLHHNGVRLHLQVDRLVEVLQDQELFHAQVRTSLGSVVRVHQGYLVTQALSAAQMPSVSLSWAPLSPPWQALLGHELGLESVAPCGSSPRALHSIVQTPFA